MNSLSLDSERPWSKDRLRQMILGQAVSGPADRRSIYIALDCEMVGVEPTGASSLARVSIVDYEGRVLLDRFVRQTKVVVDYRTRWSGIRPRDLVDAPFFEDVQDEVARIMAGRILVGHALQNDFRVLHLSYPAQYIRDTQRYKPLLRLGAGRSLKGMIRVELGIDIQAREHDSVIDARASLALFRLHQRDWERRLPHTHFIRAARPESAGTSSGAIAIEDSDAPELQTPEMDVSVTDEDGSPLEQSTIPMSSPTNDPHCKSNPSAQLLSTLSIHIIPAKLTPEEVTELTHLAESNGATITSHPSSADIILTAVGARKRLERHLDLEQARKRWILRVEWLKETAAVGERLPFQEFLALPGLTREI